MRRYAKNRKGYREISLRPLKAYGILLLFALPLPGQVDSRAAEIEAAREKKAREFQPQKTSSVQHALDLQMRFFDRNSAGIGGFHIRFGGLMTGSGFALGPEYRRPDLAHGRITFRSSAIVSTKQYYAADMELRLPKLANNRAFVSLYTAHRDSPRIDYYGPGPDSAKTGRSDYRMEDTFYDATAGIRPLRYLNLGMTGGYLQVNVGPGTAPRYISAEKIYTPFTTPGIDRQANFLRGAVFLQFDYRDTPGAPRQGGNYLVRYSQFSDRKFNLYSFRRLDVDLQQYIPLFYKRRVIALRAMSTLTDTDRGQSVPFYLEPVLGGSDDLRGFRNFRFYDRNKMALNGEYRWEIFSGLDMALFADAGKVFPSRGQLNLANLKTAYGFGFRAHSTASVVMRIDVGFSREGFQVWLKFNDVF